MSQNTLGYLAAAVGTGAAAKFAELPTPFAGLAAAAVFAVCMGVSSFLKVEPPKPQPPKQKVSKKEKRAKAAAAQAAQVDDAADAAAEAKAAEKAAKKRAKEQARKKAKRAAAAEAEAAAQQEKQEAEAAAQTEKKLTKEQAKKKKQKEKAKAKKAAKAGSAPAAEQKAEVTTAPAKKAEEPTDWEEVKVKKGKKKVEVEETDSDDKPAFTLNHYVERKYFRVIIGAGGSNLRAITEATGTEIELPKEGSMQFEVLITGPEAGCHRAKAAIDQLVAKGYCDLTHAGTVDKSVAVPDNKRGVVIGPKGVNLKLLQDKLGVKINFPEKGSDDDVSIVGESDAVTKAAAAIQSLVEQGFSSITHENYIKASVEVARDMLKNLIGPGGATIRMLQKEHSVQINVPSEKSGETVVVTLLGEAEGVAEARTQIVALMVPPEPTPIPPEWTQAASLQHLDAW